MVASKNLTRAHGQVSAQQRAQILGQQGAVIWFTGLSGSGKSTLAYALESRLTQMGHLSYVLDGDNVRMGLCSDLGFRSEDRQENIRRIGEVAALFSVSKMFVMTSFISPYQKDRAEARSKVQGDFIEVFLDVPLELCEERDPKGLYKKARNGEIADFTGVSAPYEKPESPEIRLSTSELSIDQSVETIVHYLQNKGLFSGPATSPSNQPQQGQSS